VSASNVPHFTAAAAMPQPLPAATRPQPTISLQVIPILPFVPPDFSLDKREPLEDPLVVLGCVFLGGHQVADEMPSKDRFIHSYSPESFRPALAGEAFF